MYRNGKISKEVMQTETGRAKFFEKVEEYKLKLDFNSILEYMNKSKIKSVFGGIKKKKPDESFLTFQIGEQNNYILVNAHYEFYDEKYYLVMLYRS